MIKHTNHCYRLNTQLWNRQRTGWMVGHRRDNIRGRGLLDHLVFYKKLL